MFFHKRFLSLSYNIPCPEKSYVVKCSYVKITEQRSNEKDNKMQKKAVKMIPMHQ